MPINRHTGDQGSTGVLGGKRVSKSDLIVEVLGSIDEANAVLGVARSTCRASESGEIILHIQQHLWKLMADVASAMSSPEHQGREIGAEHIRWLEEKIEHLSSLVTVPDGFLVPGDSYPAAVLDLARTVVRRAERRLVAFAQEGLHNPFVLQYLNRLSSLCYMLELQELNWISGND